MYVSINNYIKLSAKELINAMFCIMALTNLKNIKYEKSRENVR